MTDKEQIIVDRVDVSECKYLNKVVNEEPYCNIDEEHLYTCSSDENCYFKQLARKTQECEELEERKLKLELNENHNKNEIKKLKKRIRKDREFFKNKISSLTLARKQFLEALDHFNWQIGLVKNDRYRKALEEIENLMQTVSDADECSYGDFDCCNCDSDNSCPTKVKRLILDIISKAKGE